MAPSVDKSDPVIVKKYANRRLYNTDSSSYITLEHLATMTREGREFKVIDAKTGDDITHQVLTQIIMEEESTSGETLLPSSFLRQVISMYGDSMQSLVPQYLEASMDAFRANQAKFRDAVQGAFGGAAFAPFEKLAKQNMAMFDAATNMFGARKPVGPADGTKGAGADDEAAALRAQMAVLQTQLDRLGKS